MRLVNCLAKVLFLYLQRRQHGALFEARRSPGPALQRFVPMQTIVLLLAVSFLPGGALGAGCSWGAQNIQIAPYLGCAPSPKPTRV